jgi:hypothetical protein
MTTEDEETSAKPRIREARLKSEFAHLYPALEAGRWEPAALLADRMVAWLLRQPNRGYVAPDRVLRSEHFEFRGGIDKPDCGAADTRRRNPV